MARPVFSFRCSAEMQARIDEAAAAEGLTRSEWLTMAAIDFLDRGDVRRGGGELAVGLRQAAERMDRGARVEAVDAFRAASLRRLGR